MAKSTQLYKYPLEVENQKALQSMPKAFAAFVRKSLSLAHIFPLGSHMTKALLNMNSKRNE